MAMAQPGAIHMTRGSRPDSKARGPSLRISSVKACQPLRYTVPCTCTRVLMTSSGHVMAAAIPPAEAPLSSETANGSCSSLVRP